MGECLYIPGPQTLRGQVQDADAPGADLRENALLLFGADGGADGPRAYAPAPQRGHLVIHEGNERRQHEREPRQGERRDLVADGFPSSRRHDAERVASGENRVDELVLTGTK